MPSPHRLFKNSSSVFADLLGRPGIDFQPGGPVRQPYFSYRPVRLHTLTKSIPRNRFLGSINVYKYGLWTVRSLLVWWGGGGGAMRRRGGGLTQKTDRFLCKQHSRSRATCMLKLCMGARDLSYWWFDLGLACVNTVCVSCLAVSASVAPGIVVSPLCLPRSFPWGMYTFI